MHRSSVQEVPRIVEETVIVSEVIFELEQVRGPKPQESDDDDDDNNNDNNNKLDLLKIYNLCASDV
jgi:hypothetical protein